MVDSLTEVILEIDGARATLTFNRPAQLNAITETLLAEAQRVTEFVTSQPELRVLVVRGAGRAFSAGVDFRAAALPGYSKARLSGAARKLIDAWQRMPQVTIAAVTGACFAGGLSLALGVDLIVCSEQAQFCDNHARLGMYSSWGLTQRLPRLIGVQRAREMSFSARRVGAAEAVAIGLAFDAVPADQLDARVAALADSFIANSPGAVMAYKDLYRLSQLLPLEEGLHREAAARYPIDDRRARQAAHFSKVGAAGDHRGES